MHPHVNDKVAIAKRRGFLTAIEQEHGRALRRFLSRRLRHASVDAADLFQEIFLRLLRVKDHGSIRNPRAYLYTVASHVLHQHSLKRASDRLAVGMIASDESVVESQSDAADPADEVELQQTIANFGDALESLSPRAYAALVMYRCGRADPRGNRRTPWRIWADGPQISAARGRFLRSLCRGAQSQMNQPTIEDGLSERARNEAAEWFVAFCENEVDGDRKDEFDRWLRSSALHIGAYLRISALWQNANLLETGLPVVYLARPRFWLSYRWRVAACLFLALLVAGGLWWQLGQQRSYATEAAQRRTVVLPDGSRVELNARSKIKLEFSGTERGVALDEGQALFSVVKDPRRSFVVRVGESRIAAVGTQFDVYRKQAEATITVVEGQVAVSAATSPAESQVAARLMVSAGEQARLGSQLPFAARKVDVAAATSWTRGMLTFDSTPLGQVVAEYNRTGIRRLNIEDPNLLKVHISGVFPADDPRNMIKFLQRRFAAVVEETPEAIRINSATH